MTRLRGGSVAFAVTAGSLVLSCDLSSADDSRPPGTYPSLICSEEVTEVVGTWRLLRQPDEILGPAGLATRIGFVQGEEFSIFGRTFLGRANEEATAWETVKTDDTLKMRGETWASSERYLAVHGGADQTSANGGGESPLVQVLDTETNEWAIYEPPEDFGSRGLLELFWTGSDFLLWGGYSGSSEAGTALAHTDGLLLDPASGEWRPLPAAEEAAKYPSGVSGEPVNGLVSSLWTSNGLFAFGSYPESDAMYAFLYSSKDEAWGRIPTDNGPGLRKWTRLVEGNDGVYVFGGVERGQAASEVFFRELWYYSFETEHWSQVEIPDYASTFDGAWMGEHLYLFGSGCLHPTRYTPRTEEWAHVAPLNATVTGTQHVVGGRIFLAGVEDKQYTLPDIFVFEPEAE